MTSRDSGESSGGSVDVAVRCGEFVDVMAGVDSLAAVAALASAMVGVLVVRATGVVDLGLLVPHATSTTSAMPDSSATQPRRQEDSRLFHPTIA